MCSVGAMGGPAKSHMTQLGIWSLAWLCLLWTAAVPAAILPATF